MDHHIVLHIFRAQHQQTIEIQIPLCGTTSPTGALTADGNAAVSNIQKLRKKLKLEEYIQTVYKYGYRLESNPVQGGKP